LQQRLELVSGQLLLREVISSSISTSIHTYSIWLQEEQVLVTVFFFNANNMMLTFTH
jgi:hypothetical protein